MSRDRVKRGLTRRCVYCGHGTTTFAYPAVCAVHKPLLKLDPYYAEARA